MTPWEPLPSASLSRETQGPARPSESWNLYLILAAVRQGQGLTVVGGWLKPGTPRAPDGRSAPPLPGWSSALPAGQRPLEAVHGRVPCVTCPRTRSGLSLARQWSLTPWGATPTQRRRGTDTSSSCRVGDTHSALSGNVASASFLCCSSFYSVSPPLPLPLHTVPETRPCGMYQPL